MSPIIDEVKNSAMGKSHLAFQYMPIYSHHSVAMQLDAVNKNEKYKLNKHTNRQC